METADILPFALGVLATLAAAFAGLAVRRRLAEQSERIAQADRRFKATFDQAAVGIAHLDPEGRWLRVNDRFCTIAGYPREELLQKSYRDITHPDDLSDNLVMQRALLAGEADHASVEKRYIAKNGQTVWIHSTGSLVRDAHGQPDFFVSVIEDISARRDAELALQDSEARLAMLQNEFAHLSRVNDLGEMAAAIAHEINQPLTAIVNLLGTGRFIAEEGYSEDGFADVHQLIRQASDQALRAGDIIRRLREFIGHGNGQWRVEPIDALVDATMALALIDASASGVAIERHAGARDVVVWVDALQIQQVLVNLLRNAVEAMTSAEDGVGGAHCLTVQTRVLPDGMVEIGVIDNGPGIAPELRERLFQPFVTTKSKGMGMGLSVCRRLIEAHGGTIAISAGPDGKGAAFRFTLPQFSSETEQPGG